MHVIPTHYGTVHMITFIYDRIISDRALPGTVVDLYCIYLRTRRFRLLGALEARLPRPQRGAGSPARLPLRMAEVADAGLLLVPVPLRLQ